MDKLCANNNINLLALGAFGRVSTAGGNDGKSIANLSEDKGTLTCAGRYSVFARRSEDDVRNNNMVREQLLANLCKAFGCAVKTDISGRYVFSKEHLSALKQRLGGVLKAGNFGLDSEGHVSSGRPLTERRISAIVDKMNALRGEQDAFAKTEKDRCETLASGLSKVFCEDGSVGLKALSVDAATARMLREKAVSIWGFDKGDFLERHKDLSAIELRFLGQSDSAGGCPARLARERANLMSFIGLYCDKTNVDVATRQRLMDFCDGDNLVVASAILSIKKAFDESGLTTQVAREAMGRQDLSRQVKSLCVDVGGLKSLLPEATLHEAVRLASDQPLFKLAGSCAALVDFCKSLKAQGLDPQRVDRALKGLPPDVLSAAATIKPLAQRKFFEDVVFGAGGALQDLRDSYVQKEAARMQKGELTEAERLGRQESELTEAERQIVRQTPWNIPHPVEVRQPHHRDIVLGFLNAEIRKLDGALEADYKEAVKADFERNMQYTVGGNRVDKTSNTTFAEFAKQVDDFFGENTKARSFFWSLAQQKAFAPESSGRQNKLSEEELLPFYVSAGMMGQSELMKFDLEKTTAGYRLTVHHAIKRPGFITLLGGNDGVKNLQFENPSDKDYHEYSYSFDFCEGKAGEAMVKVSMAEPPREKFFFSQMPVEPV